VGVDQLSVTLLVAAGGVLLGGGVVEPVEPVVEPEDAGGLGLALCSVPELHPVSAARVIKATAPTQAKRLAAV